MELNGLSNKLLRLLFRMAGSNDAGQIGHISTPARARFFIDNNVLHCFKPACFRTLLRVPGGRSSLDDLLASRARLARVFVLPVATSRPLKLPSISFQHLYDIANLLSTQLRLHQERNFLVRTWCGFCRTFPGSAGPIVLFSLFSACSKELWISNRGSNPWGQPDSRHYLCGSRQTHYIG